jgi:formate hydrogenlyase subunit 6/NADH:ubiquinone oxidoreductase subunit I
VVKTFIALCIFCGFSLDCCPESLMYDAYKYIVSYIENFKICLLHNLTTFSSPIRILKKIKRRQQMNPVQRNNRIMVILKEQSEYKI